MAPADHRVTSRSLSVKPVPPCRPDVETRLEADSNDRCLDLMSVDRLEMLDGSSGAKSCSLQRLMRPFRSIGGGARREGVRLRLEGFKMRKGSTQASLDAPPAS
jgi:hypothetical protein